MKGTLKILSAVLLAGVCAWGMSVLLQTGEGSAPQTLSADRNVSVSIVAPASADEGDNEANADEGLYDPVAPEGSAFVRFFNAIEGESVKPEANGKAYAALGFGESSSYVVVPQGDAQFVFGGAAGTEQIVSGEFYTVVRRGSGQLLVLKDEPNTNKAKALLTLYNFSGHEGLTLKTEDGKIAIIESVALDSESARKINPVSLGFSLYEGDKSLLTLEGQPLERGMAYGLFALSKESGEVVLVRVEGRTDTKL